MNKIDSRRLTNELRIQTKNAMLRHTHRAAVLTHRVDRAAFASAVLDAAWGSYRNVSLGLPLWFFPETHELSMRLEGLYVRFSLNGKSAVWNKNNGILDLPLIGKIQRRVPYALNSHTNAEAFLIPRDSDLFTQWELLEQTTHNLLADMATLTSQINGNMRAFTTVNQILTAWPEAAVFIPQSVDKIQRQFPVALETINKQLRPLPSL